MPKAKDTPLEEKTVEELRELATEQEIEGRSAMNKDELVQALSGPQKTPEQKGQAGETTDNPPTFPLAGMKITGQENQGKEETRLFQVSPDEKMWLTQKQAENPPKDKETGKLLRPKFYWKEEKS